MIDMFSKSIIGVTTPILINEKVEMAVGLSNAKVKNSFDGISTKTTQKN